LVSLSRDGIDVGLLTPRDRRALLGVLAEDRDEGLKVPKKVWQQSPVARVFLIAGNLSPVEHETVSVRVLSFSGTL